MANGSLTAAKEGVDAAQEQVRIGLIEFENGRSTAFELVRLGADFAVAHERYSQALVRSAKAAANLRQLTSGNIFTVPWKIIIKSPHVPHVHPHPHLCCD